MVCQSKHQMKASRWPAWLCNFARCQMEFVLPHTAEAVSGQLPVVAEVNIVEVHQSRAQDSQHSGPVPRPVVSVGSSHNVPHHNGLHPLLLEDRTEELHTGF